MIVYHAYKKDSPEFYIGKTIHTLEHRRRQHENESMRGDRCRSHFHNAMRKYGFDSFEWVELEKCRTLEELNTAEKRWIKLVRECGHKLFNIADGGNGGDCGGSKYWKKHSPSVEMRRKISKGLKAHYKNNPHAMKGITCKGHSHTQESKLKQSLSMMGHEVSEQTRQKLRVANLGKKLNDDVVEMLRNKFSGKNNPSAKPIICTTTGEYFDYARLASIKYGIDLSSIIKCCRGKQKTCNKMKFEYSPTAYPAGWKKL